jgi:hypothetical protein
MSGYTDFIHTENYGGGGGGGREGIIHNINIQSGWWQQEIGARGILSSLEKSINEELNTILSSSLFTINCK